MEEGKVSTTNIDRPLDEIIKETRQAKRAELAAKRKTAAAAKAKDAPAAPIVALPASEAKLPAFKGRNGIVKNARRRAKREAARAVASAVAAVDRSGGEPMGQNTSATRGPPVSRRLTTQARKPVVRKGVKVAVSNLHPGVTESDIAELFETVGPLKSAHLRTYPDGASACEAEVVFESMGDALDAIKRYNKVPLDNQPLHITLATVSVSNAEPVQARIGKPRGGRGQPFNGRRKGAGEVHDFEDDPSPQRNGFDARESPRRDRGGHRGQGRRGNRRRFRGGRVDRGGANGVGNMNGADRGGDRGDRNSYDD